MSRRSPVRGFRATRRAVGLLIAAGFLLAIGRVFGIARLFPLAVTVGALVGVTALVVRWLPIPVTAERRVLPAHAHAGAPARVDIILRAERRSGVMTLRDPFDGGRRWARFRVAPIPGGRLETAAYRVPTDRRGVFPIGPMQIERSDPLGMFTRVVEITGEDVLTVYPPIHHIAPLPHTRGNDPRGGTIARPALGASGEEFYALRPYVMGDDLRRVHWPSSARSDELLIRQDELPWQGRATVVVDVRSTVHTAASFEAAMSAAASICVACADAGVEVRMLGSDGVDTGFGSGHHHVEDILERLAAWDVDAIAKHHLIGALATANLGRESALAVVTSDRAAPADFEASARTRGGRLAILVVLGEGRAQPAPAGVVVVRARTLASFPQAWAARFGPAPRHRLAMTPVVFS
jgi:uncharacterized protein (DUF58 family)